MFCCFATNSSVLNTFIGDQTAKGGSHAGQEHHYYCPDRCLLPVNCHSHYGVQGCKEKHNVQAGSAKGGNTRWW